MERSARILPLILVLTAAACGLARDRVTEMAPSAGRAPASPSATAAEGCQGPFTAVAAWGAETVWVGGQCGLWTSNDGGRTWMHGYREPTRVLSLDLVDPQVGWALTEGGLLRTNDGGRTWHRVGQPQEPLQEIEFVSSTRGWGIESAKPLAPITPGSAGGSLVETSDGGEVWRPVGLQNITSVSAVSEAVAWAAGGNRVYRTSDGGKTWIEVLAAPIPEASADGTVATVRAADAKHAWVHFQTPSCTMNHCYYILFRTVDGGGRWTALAQNQWMIGSAEGRQTPKDALPGKINRLVQAGPDWAVYEGVCDVCVGQPVLLATTLDGGASWSSRTVPGLNSPTLVPMAFSSQERGWVAGTGGQEPKVLATADGGRTWRELSPGG